MAMPDASLRLLRAYLGRLQEPIVGALPEEPKLDMPLPAGAELVGSVLHRHPPMVTAYIDSGLETSEIVSFYEREYDARGWRPQLPNMPQMQMSGFMAAGGGQPPPHMRVFCKGEAEPYYRLEVLPDQPRIRLSWHAMSQGVVHPCSTQPMQPGMHGPSPDVIPRLEGPADVPIRGGGGGGSSDEWSTYGSAHTTMPAAELMDHFARSISEQDHELIEPVVSLRADGLDHGRGHARLRRHHLMERADRSDIGRPPMKRRRSRLDARRCRRR